MESVQEFAFRKGFAARNVKPAQGEIWARLPSLRKEDESETGKSPLVMMGTRSPPFTFVLCCLLQAFSLM